MHRGYEHVHGDRTDAFHPVSSAVQHDGYLFACTEKLEHGLGHLPRILLPAQSKAASYPPVLSPVAALHFTCLRPGFLQCVTRLSSLP
jgi:hypothetical protein